MLNDYQREIALRILTDISEEKFVYESDYKASLESSYEEHYHDCIYVLECLLDDYQYIKRFEEDFLKITSKGMYAVEQSDKAIDIFSHEFTVITNDEIIEDYVERNAVTEEEIEDIWSDALSKAGLSQIIQTNPNPITEKEDELIPKADVPIKQRTVHSPRLFDIREGFRTSMMQFIHMAWKEGYFKVRGKPDSEKPTLTDVFFGFGKLLNYDFASKSKILTDLYSKKPNGRDSGSLYNIVNELRSLANEFETFIKNEQGVRQRTKKR